MTSRLAVLAILGAVLIYGGNFASNRHAILNGLTLYDLTALRFGVAGLVLLPVFLHRGVRDCAGIGWRRGLLLAMTTGIPMTLLMNAGLSLAPAAHGASLQPGTATVVGLAIGTVLMRAWPRAHTLLGIFVVSLGLACIAIAGTTSGARNVLLGDLCFLLAGSLFSLYAILVQRWRIDAITGAAIVAVLSMVYLPAYVLWLDPQLGAVGAGTLAFHAVNQGVLNFVVALWLWGYAVQALGAENVQRFSTAIPVVGTLLAIPIVGEWPGPLQSAGILLIVTGLTIATFGGRVLRRFAPTL